MTLRRAISLCVVSLLFGAVAVLLISGIVTRPGVAQGQLELLLPGLRSSAWEERAEAMRELIAAPDIVASEDVLDALVDLTARENAFRDLLLQEFAQGLEIEAPGDGYGEYYDELTDVLYENADFSDPRNLQVFSQAYFSPGSAWARKMAGVGETVVPLMLARSQDFVSTKRESALSVLSIVLTSDTLPTDTVETIRERIRSGMEDADVTVRWTAVTILGDIGDARDIPLLGEWGRALTRHCRA